MSDQPKTTAEMAEFLRSCGSETGDAIAAAIEKQQAAIELAYGLLWFCPEDRASVNGERVFQARQALRSALDREGKLRGVKAAQDLTPLPSKMN